MKKVPFHDILFILFLTVAALAIIELMPPEMGIRFLFITGLVSYWCGKWIKGLDIKTRG